MKKSIIESIQLTHDSPKYVQIAAQIEQLIDSGALPENLRLPAIRSLASGLSVNQVTVVKAYDLLERKGVVRKRVGSGVYVEPSALFAKPAIPESDELYLDEEISLMREGSLRLTDDLINFATATPSSELFPVGSFKLALNSVLDRDGGRAFEYDEPNGYRPLREQVSALMKSRYGVSVIPEQLQVISGAQQGIDIAAKALLRPGDGVIVEDPTYTGALAVFKSRGVRIFSVPMTSRGMSVSRLRNLLMRYSAKLIYLMPDNQNPTSVCYAPERRREILALAREFGCFIIEDDYLSDMYFDAKARLKPLKSYDDPDDERVIYIKSFSKLIMPGLRVGFLASPASHARSILQAKHLTDIASSGLIQRAFCQYISSGEWEGHLERLRTLFRYRHGLLVNAVTRLLGSPALEAVPPGGFNLWVRLPDGVKASEVYKGALKENVLVTPGDVFRVGKVSHDDHLRLSIAAVPEELIEKGIEILSHVIAELSEEVNGDSRGRARMTPLM